MRAFRTSSSEILQPPGGHLRLLREEIMASLRTAVPGIVQQYDPAKQTVTVQPAIMENLGETAQSLPLLQDVPVFFAGGSKAAMTYQVNPGDECLVLFADTAIDAWMHSGGVQVQAVPRRHSLSDGFALVGFRSNPNALPISGSDAFAFRMIIEGDWSVPLRIAQDGTVYIGEKTLDGEIESVRQYVDEQTEVACEWAAALAEDAYDRAAALAGEAQEAADAAQEAADQALLELDELAIGGRNLLPETSDSPQTITAAKVYSDLDIAMDATGWNDMVTFRSWIAPVSGSWFLRLEAVPNPSTSAALGTAIIGSMRIGVGDAYTVESEPQQTAGWATVTMKIPFVESKVRASIVPVSSGEASYSKAKLELGNKPTQWEPSADDQTVALVNIAHPVGSIIQTADTTFNPNTLWSWTTWHKAEGVFLFGANGSIAAGATGGSGTATVAGTTITVNGINVTLGYKNLPELSAFAYNTTGEQDIINAAFTNDERYRRWVSNTSSNVGIAFKSYDGSDPDHVNTEPLTTQDQTFTIQDQTISTMPPYLAVIIWIRDT